MYNEAIFYNENSYCTSCMRCVGSCKLKAVKFIDNLPKIIDEYCVNCGECYINCSPRAIEYINSIEYINGFIKGGKMVVASLSPTWVSEFRGISPSVMISLLKSLGFTHISETTHGATEMLKGVEQHLNNKPQLTIASMCPAISSTVVKYYPHLVPYLLPIDTPVVLHSKQLRMIYGDDIKVISITSCVAEKSNYNHSPRHINATLTFKELKKWFEERGLDYRTHTPNEELNLTFQPFNADRNFDYIFASGSLLKAVKGSGQDMSFISFSGMENGVNTLDLIDVNNLEKPTFINLLACKDGCFSTAGSILRGDNIHKLLTYKEYYSAPTCQDVGTMPTPSIAREYSVERIDNILDINQVKVDSVLNSLYTSPTGKQIDCGKCGYPTCRDFAKGIVRGMAERINCAPHYQNILRSNFSIMINNTPYSTFVADNALNIIESNSLFQELIGMPKSELGALSSDDIGKYVSFVGDIKSMFDDKRIHWEHDVIVRGKMLRVTMFALRNHKYVCGIVRNMVSGDVLGDEIISKTRKVISDNIEGVQKIALLLGENASRTEALLNSMLDIHKTDI